MEIDSLLQLSLSLQATLLGWTLGLLYDLLRALRLRSQKAFVSSALDILYGLLVLTFLLLFALRAAGGELRVYLLICFFGGAVFFFAACSEVLRPLWDFWINAALSMIALFLLPFRFLHRLGKKFAFYVKKLFHFQKKYYIIRQHRRRFPQGKRRNA